MATTIVRPSQIKSIDQSFFSILFVPPTNPCTYCPIRILGPLHLFPVTISLGDKILWRSRIHEDNNTIHHLNCKMLGDGDVRHGYPDNLYSLLHKSDHSFNYFSMLIGITRCQVNLIRFLF